MVKIDLITGFLGSGKTTFLLKYARYLMKKGMRIGILEYDYGAVNVDMMLVSALRCSKCEIEMVAAGCDTQSLWRRFRTKLIAMAMSGYDRVIVEPSGVFDMDQFYDTLRDEPLDSWYEIGNVLTIVSAELPEQQSPQADFLLASQAVSAGCILLSRVQLCSEEKIASVKEHINQAAAGIGCPRIPENYFEKDWNELEDADFERLLNSGCRIGDYVKTIAGSGSDFESVCLMELKGTAEELQNRVQRLFEETRFGKIFRVKGFIHDSGGSRLLNASSDGITLEPTGLGRDILIVIGEELQEEAIRKLLKGENDV